MERTIQLVSLCLALTISTLAMAQFPNSRGELKPGRYIGWITLDGRNERIAAVADFFLESPEDLRNFPRLVANLRLSLGGYNSHEYITETFKDLKYDFDNGNLTFNESERDLLMTTKIYQQGGRAKVVGQVFVRSSATTGSVELLEESDEPGDDENITPLSPSENGPFIPLLDGQYEGDCNGNGAAFQVQTVRGLQADEVASRGSGLERHYGITARLAFKNDSFCGDLPSDRWCTKLHFKKGSYNFYLGKLNLQGEQSSEECRIKSGEITCRIRTFREVLACKFTKKQDVAESPRFFTRRFSVFPTEEQNQDLPPPAPPLNEALSTALRGSFFGYVHNETNDVYFPVRLDIFPYSSTDNPHNPNQMMISSTASIYLGGASSESIVTQRYEPCSFYIRPGFTLSGPDADSFISINEWKMGYIRGVWQSHEFGKVGTVQLVKGALPTLPKEAKVLPSFAGEFKRTLHRSQISQWIRFIFPAQPNDLNDHLIRFSGSYQAAVGTTPIRDIERGTFDPYTGRIGWLILKDDASTFGSGYIDTEAARLFFPPSPIFGVVANSYIYERFEREEIK